MRAVITVGVSGSGKSTFAKSLSLTHHEINRDWDRWNCTGKCGWNGDNAYRFDKNVEKYIDKLHNIDYRTFSEIGRDIVISNTNLNTKKLKKLLNKLEDLGYEVEIKEFPISFPEALRRDKERGIFSVGEEVLKRQWEMWVTYHMEKLENA